MVDGVITEEEIRKIVDGVVKALNDLEKAIKEYTEYLQRLEATLDQIVKDKLV